MYKNYELKNIFYHFTKKYSTVAVLFFEEVEIVFTVTQLKKKKIESQPMEKAKKL